MLPGTAGKHSSVHDLGLSDAFLSVGPVSDLIDIVADGGQFAQQGGVLIWRPRAELCAGNQLSDKGADAKTRSGANLIKVIVLLIV